MTPVCFRFLVCTLFVGVLGVGAGRMALADAPNKGRLGVDGTVGAVDATERIFEIRAKTLPQRRARVIVPEKASVLRLTSKPVAEIPTGTRVWVLAVEKEKKGKVRLTKVAAVAIGEFLTPDLRPKRVSSKKGFAWFEGPIEKHGDGWMIGGVATDFDSGEEAAVFEAVPWAKVEPKARVHVDGEYQRGSKTEKLDRVEAKRVVLIETKVSAKALGLYLNVGFVPRKKGSILGV